MVEFRRGQKSKLADLTAGTDLYVGVRLDAPGLTFDITCFGLDTNEKMDEQYFVFFNQPKTPEESVQLLGEQAGDQQSFRVMLDRVPAHIGRLAFTATIDGDGVMGQVTSGYLRVAVGGQEVVRYPFTGGEFSTERAIMIADLYRKDVWRIAAVGQGFDGGLDALVRHFGGEVAEDEPAAAPPQQAPAFAPPPGGQPAPQFGAPPAGAPAPAFGAAPPMPPQSGPGFPPPGAPQPQPQPAAAQPGPHGPHGTMPMHQPGPGMPPQGPPPQGPPPGQFPNQPGMPPQGMPPQGPPQGMPPQGPPPGMPPQGAPGQFHPGPGMAPPAPPGQFPGQPGMPQGMPPQGMPPQGPPPGAFPGQPGMPQGMPPQGMPPQGMPGQFPGQPGMPGPGGAPLQAGPPFHQDPAYQYGIEQFREVPTQGRWTLQNARMVKANITGGTKVIAKQGVMVAYQGDVDFKFQGQGMRARRDNRLTGQSMELMKVEGHGEVFFAQDAANLHIVELQGQSLCVNAANILAYDEGLTLEPYRFESQGIPGGGLFAQTITGNGTVVIMTKGIPVMLQMGGGPTFADSNAIVAWTHGPTMRVSVSTQVRLRRTAFPGHSGETVSLQFRGMPGNFIVVQPYEV